MHTPDALARYPRNVVYGEASQSDVDLYAAVRRLLIKDGKPDPGRDFKLTFDDETGEYVVREGSHNGGLIIPVDRFLQPTGPARRVHANPGYDPDAAKKAVADWLYGEDD